MIIIIYYLFRRIFFFFMFRCVFLFETVVSFQYSTEGGKSLTTIYIHIDNLKTVHIARKQISSYISILLQMQSYLFLNLYIYVCF